MKTGRPKIKIDIKKAKRLYSNGVNHREIAELMGLKRATVRRRLKEAGVVKRSWTGESSHSWKGKDVSYSAFHIRINKIRGRPKRCSHCGTEKKRKFEWANISGKYHDVNDYIRLCVPCHREFDKTS